MNTRRHTLLAAAALPAFAAGCATTRSAATRDELAAQVRAAEVGFARTMAERDFAAFGSFVAGDAVFVNGGKPLRGKAAILEHWQRFFAAPAAPFSWQPEIVEIAANARLGYTEGPVMDPAGKTFAKFYTTWQLAPDGRWLVVFDNGYTICRS